MFCRLNWCPKDILGKAPTEAPHVDVEAPTASSEVGCETIWSGIAQQDTTSINCIHMSIQYYTILEPGVSPFQSYELPAVCRRVNRRKPYLLYLLSFRPLRWWNRMLVRQQPWCRGCPVSMGGIGFKVRRTDSDWFGLILMILMDFCRSRNGQTVEIVKLSKRFGQLRAVENLDLVLFLVQLGSPFWDSVRFCLFFSVTQS